MKKLIILMMVLLLAITPALAKQPSCNDLGYDRDFEPPVGSIDNECMNAGFDFGIAKWAWNESSNSFDLETEINGYDTNVTGDDTTAYWSSNPEADGILSKEGKCYQDLFGGDNGTIYNVNYGISHVTFCGYEEEIPEFGTIAASIALIGAVAGFLLLRKRD